MNSNTKSDDKIVVPYNIFESIMAIDYLKCTLNNLQQNITYNNSGVFNKVMTRVGIKIEEHKQIIYNYLQNTNI